MIKSLSNEEAVKIYEDTKSHLNRYCCGCTSDYLEAVVKESQRRTIEQVIEFLDITENELGFCEISNHIPYTELKELVK